MSAKTDDTELDQALEETRAPRSRRSTILGIMAAIQILFALCFLHMAGSWVYKMKFVNGSDAVIELSDTSLPFHIAGHPNGTIVMFHAADCIYCKKMMPDFEAAAKELQKIGDTSLVSVNAAAAPSALQRYSVTRFPTLLWFRRGELVRFVPPYVRTLPTILEFVDNSLQPAIIPFASRADFDEAVPQLRAVLPSGSLPVIVVFGESLSAQHDIEIVAERFRGDTAFLRVPESREGDPVLSAFYRDASLDKIYNGSGFVQSWVQALMTKDAKKKGNSSS